MRLTVQPPLAKETRGLSSVEEWVTVSQAFSGQLNMQLSAHRTLRFVFRLLYLANRNYKQLRAVPL